jgi:hypothetical protein
MIYWCSKLLYGGGLDGQGTGPAEGVLDKIELSSG